MIVRLKLKGKGTREDSYNGNVPTGVEILTLVDQGVTYWNIPDTDHPKLDEHPSAKTEETAHGPALIALDATGHAAWYQHLDERYKERKGDFRPEIA